MPLVLDTSAYNALLAGNNDVVAVVSRAQELLIPQVVIGELRYGYVKGSKQAENELRLERFLSEPNITITTLSNETTKQFGILHALAERSGRTLSHNDLWIAATAQEYQAELITLDKDFSVFTDLFAGRLHLPQW